MRLAGTLLGLCLALGFPVAASAQTIRPESANLPLLPCSRLADCAIESMPGTEVASPDVQCVEVPEAEALTYWVTYVNGLYRDGWSLEGVAGNGFLLQRTASTGWVQTLDLAFNRRREVAGSPIVLGFAVFAENTRCTPQQ